MSTVRETIDGLRGGGRGRTLLVVAGGWLLLSGFRVVLPALLPAVKADFGVDNASAGFALTVLWLVYAGMQFPSGLVADRAGERTLLIVGALLAAVSLGLFAVVPLFPLFLLACALFGFGAGLFGTPRDMLLSRTFPASDSTAYSVTFAAGSLGAAALPYLATAIANRWGWRLAVVWLLPPLLVVGVGLWRVVAPRDGGATGGAATAGAGGGITGARETVRRTARAVTNRSVLAAAGVMILSVFTYQALLSFLPTYLVEVKGLDAGTAAALFGLLFVFGAVVQSVAGHVADRHGERRAVLALIGLATATLVALPFVEGVLALSALVPLLGVRIAVGPLASAFIVRELPTAARGSGWGLLRTLFFGIGATGSSVIGVLADAGLFDAGFLFLAALTGLTTLFWLAIPRAATDGGRA